MSRIYVGAVNWAKPEGARFTLLSYKEVENEDEMRSYLTKKILEKEKGILYGMVIMEILDEDIRTFIKRNPELCEEKHDDK